MPSQHTSKERSIWQLSGVGHIQYNTNGALPAFKAQLMVLICKEALTMKVNAFSSTTAVTRLWRPEVAYRCAVCWLLLCALHLDVYACTSVSQTPPLSHTPHVVQRLLVSAQPSV
jgi:hypothetical protein